jgi:hypothetical protein
LYSELHQYGFLVRILIEQNLRYLKIIANSHRTGLANLWHRERLSWHAAFIAVPFFISFARPASLYCAKHVYIHISDCVETVYELRLLPNNIASEIFLNKSGALRSVDWIFITEARLGGDWANT